MEGGGHQKTVTASDLFRPSCKSTESKTSYVVKFRNLAENDAMVFWLNFQGNPVFYALIKKTKATEEGMVGINTFLTHPWMAVDRKRKALYAINFSRVLRPTSEADLNTEKLKKNRLRTAIKSKDESQINSQADQTDQTDKPHIDAFITDLVFSLEDTCCLKICRMMTEDDINAMDVPDHIKVKLLDIYETWMIPA